MDPKERRSSPRRPIKLAAQVDLGEAGMWPCQIADFCAEGLFVRYSGDTSARIRAYLERYPGEDLGIYFRTGDSQERHQLKARPARLIDGAMGVEFTRSSPRAVEAMLSQCGADGESQERVSLKPPSERVQFILHQCARSVTRHIEPLMSDCFVAMAENLRQAALKAASDQQANEFMDAASQVGSRQRSFWLLMSRYLESPLKPEREGQSTSSLSLVDKGEFEDWLAIKVMVTKADTLYRAELLQLRMRLDRLGVTNATGHQNPLGPSLVCEAFHTGLESLRASRGVEKVCLKTFETLVLQKIGPLYEELNQILIRHGILPDLDLSRYLSERKPRSEPPKPAPALARAANEPVTPVVEKKRAPGAGSTPSGDGRSQGFQEQMTLARSAFETVRNLVGSLKAGRVAEQAPLRFAENARPLSQGELQAQLHTLQRAPQPGEEAAPLKDRVIDQVKRSGDHALDEEQQATLDVVDRFFRSVVESPRLTEHARQQMRHLEVPVLKVVLRDPAFFDDIESPVRGVMNRLAQLGARGGRTNPAVQRRVDDLVDRIAAEFEQDSQVFEGAVGELDTLIDRQNLIYRRNVERVTAAAEGAQKVAESRSAVGRALDERLGGREVPRAVVSLLNAGWRDLLSLTWIRQGPDSQLWQDYLSVLDTLMAFADDPETTINLSELLRLIQEGLGSISSNHLPATQVREELKQFLVRSPGTTMERVAMPRAGSEQDPGRKQEERLQRRLQRWIARAQKLRTGDWLKDQSNGDQVQYIRLVWIARGFNRFVFVNHQGMRVVELELADLAERMQKGLIVPDSQYERPLVDESIDRMVRKVYEQLSWASSHDELTGLLERREFERVLEQQLSRHEDERTLVRLDLRQFRLLNDTAGLAAGDEALRRVAGILREKLVDGMPLARLDGDEFGFLLPSEEAAPMVAGIIHAIETLELNWQGRSYRLSASAGLAPQLPGLATAGRWLRATEEACRLAKTRGSGKYAVYQLEPEHFDKQEQIAAKVASLGDLDEERMLLRCQKIIPLHKDTRLTTQYEVLISMYDDQGELITAADFVRMAERYNRMQFVDRWVVGYMLDWLRNRNGRQGSAGQRQPGYCINLSGYSLNDEALLEFIYSKLSEADAPIERLWFEITEAAAIRDVHSVAEFIGEMQELGCRFCLGSFGAGPASYQYMRSLPVDMIKLDGAFVGQIAESETDQAMVRSMVEMAHYLNREVIATHIESREALDMLRKLGVDYGQGYVIEKPGLLESLGAP
jgi:diguanylate cyclase (GGDEF)-like protein